MSFTQHAKLQSTMFAPVPRFLPHERVSTQRTKTHQQTVLYDPYPSVHRFVAVVCRRLPRQHVPRFPATMMHCKCVRATLCAHKQPNVDSFTISDYVSIFFFLRPCGNASFHFSLRLHNRAFTCALLIRVMLQGVLPIQNVAAPRRSSPEAPKPNVVNAWRGGPLSPALDCNRTPFSVECIVCCTRCVGLRIAHSWRRLQA